MIEIASVEDMHSVAVEVPDEEWPNYIRYGPDCWMVTMGMSDESVMDCTEIEKAYQDYIK